MIDLTTQSTISTMVESVSNPLHCTMGTVKYVDGENG